MIKKTMINNREYEILKNYKECYNKEDVEKKYTDYFDDYDYIFGDYSYDTLRLKGFCDKANKIHNNINSIDKLDEYIEKYCAYECKYFLIKLEKE